MILGIDVGNTNIVIGCLEEGRIVGVTRMETDRDKTAHEYAIALRQALAFGSITPDGMEGCLLSSVVPPLNDTLCAAVRMVTGLDTLVVGPGIKTGLNIGVDDPATVGADLVVGAAAALSICEPPIIVIDMGTATTITVIDQSGRFIGGAIAPGLNVSAKALADTAAQLPHISLEPPKKAISTETVECMRSGIVLGAACMIDGMISRMEEELGSTAAVIATGGLSGKIAPLCRHEIRYERNLLLNGLWVIWERNQKKRR